MTRLARPALLLCLLALPALAEDPLSAPPPPPPPAVDAPSAAANVPHTGVKLLPAGTEVEYRGGQVPTGTHLIHGANPDQRRLGLYLMVGGVVVQGAAFLGTLGFGVYMMVTAGQAYFSGLAGVALVLASPLLLLPVVGPLLAGLVFLQSIPLISLACLALIGLEIAGAVVWATADRQMVRYDQEAPAYPLEAMRSGAVPALPPAGTLAWRF